MLILPNVILFFDLETAENNENRAFQKAPEFNFKTPTKSIVEFKNFYTENFGLKTTLVNNYIDFKFKVLKETPMPNKVVKGLNGWYFLGNSYNNTLNNAFGRNYFNTDDMQEISRRISEIQTYLNSQDIAFYVVVPPNKNSIYKEYLPYQFKQHKSKLNVLKTYLKEQINFEIIDLTEPLLAQKQDHQLYHKTDSHWNDYGAFIGYRETLKIINNNFNIPTVSLEDYNTHIEAIEQGDIIKMINLNLDESTLIFSKKTVETNSVEQRPKLVMHHDSFSYIWMPYFNESFNDIIYLQDYVIHKEQIKKEKPDLIIFEIVERNIDLLLNKKSLLVD